MNDSWNRRQLRKLIERVGRLERVQDTDREVVRLGEDWHLEDGALYIYDDDGNLRTRVGKQYDGTYTSRDRNGPIPPTPFMPEVRRRVNGLVVIWDGTFANSDDAPPQDFRYVAVHASKDPAFVPSFETERATIVSEDGGQAFVALPASDEWHIALQTVTTSYRRSGKSEQVAAIPRASYLKFEADDTYTVTAADVTAGTATMPLSHVPLRESLVGFWGGVPQPPTEYVIDYAAGSVAWKLTGIVKAGDKLWVHYAYDTATDAEPAPPLDLDEPGFVIVPAQTTTFESTGISSDGRGDTDLTHVGNVSVNGGGFAGSNKGVAGPTPGVPPWEPGMRFFVLGTYSDTHQLSETVPNPSGDPTDPPVWVDWVEYGYPHAQVFYFGAQLRDDYAPSDATIYYRPTGSVKPAAANGAIEVFSLDGAGAGESSVVGHCVDGQTSVQFTPWGIYYNNPPYQQARKFPASAVALVLWYPSLAAAGA